MSSSLPVAVGVVRNMEAVVVLVVIVSSPSLELLPELITQ
jgi:hypothetical protein